MRTSASCTDFAHLLTLCAAFTTITSTAVLFAKTTLNMPASALIIIGMLVPASGVAGALIWPRIQRNVPALNSAKVGPKGNLRLLMLLIIIAWLVPVYGSLGFVLGFGGLTTWAEMYVFAVYFGQAISASSVAPRAPLTIFHRRGVRSVSVLRPDSVCRSHSAGSRGTMVCAVLHHRQVRRPFLPLTRN